MTILQGTKKNRNYIIKNNQSQSNNIQQKMDKIQKFCGNSTIFITKSMYVRKSNHF